MAQTYQIGDLTVSADERLEFCDSDGESLAELDGKEVDELVDWLANVRGKAYQTRSGEPVVTE